MQDVADEVGLSSEFLYKSLLFVKIVAETFLLMSGCFCNVSINKCILKRERKDDTE